MSGHIVRRRRRQGDMCLDSSLDTSDGGGACLFGSLTTPGHERREVRDSLGFIEAKVIVQEEEELFLHQVDLGGVKQLRKPCPMFILGRGVVEVFGSNDECREEHAMPSTRHPYVDGISPGNK